MTKSRITVDNGYFFIISLALFILNAVLITVLLARDFKNTTDLFSYFFAISGSLIMLKTFIVSYANYTLSIKDKRYYALIANAIVMGFQLVCVFLALIWFKDDSYPQVSVGYYLLASIGLISQIILGKLTNSIKFQIFSFLYYLSLFGLLYYRIFNADIRYLQIIGLISIFIEIVMLLNLYRNFQLKKIISIE